MKTTFTKSFEKGFLHGLAGVSRRKSRKQVLQDIVSEAENAMSMAKGLQGHGDWHGAASKVVSSAGLLDQAIDLAETLPGVDFERTRKQAKLIIKRVGAVMPLLDVEPLSAREKVQACETALTKATEAIRLFADRLRDDILVKDGEKIDFDENEIIKEVDKLMTGASEADPGAGKRQRIGQKAGVFQTGETSGGWEPVPGKAGRQRRKKEDGTYEYRDVGTAVAASVENEDVKKDEEPENPEEGTSEETSEMEGPKATEKPAETQEPAPEEQLPAEEKTLDPQALLQQGQELGELAKTKKKKGKKLKPGSLKGGKSEPASSAKPGEGGRFDALVEDLQSKGLDEDALMNVLLEKYKVRDPAALAAAIGRAKYGKKRFQEMAAAGRKKSGKKKSDDRPTGSVLKGKVNEKTVRTAALNAAADIFEIPNRKLIDGMIKDAIKQAKDTEDAIQIVIDMMRSSD